MTAAEPGDAQTGDADLIDVEAVYGPSPHPASRGVVGYAPGAFDTFHIGHLNLLRRASLRCDYLIVGVVSDEVALIQKGSEVMVPEDERLAVVASMEFVDEVVLERTTDKLATWEQVRFDVVFKGSDWVGSEKWTALEREFALRGVSVTYLPYSDHTSSSQVRRMVQDAHDSLPAAHPE